MNDLTFLVIPVIGSLLIAAGAIWLQASANRRFDRDAADRKAGDAARPRRPADTPGLL